MRIMTAIVLSLALVSCAFAGEVGRVTYAEGRVDVLSPGAEKAVFAKEGTFINVGDSVRVKANSKAEITFNDKTALRIAENSKVDVVDYQLYGDNYRKTATIKLDRGKIRTTIAKMKDSAEFNIDTPNANGTVKGSDIFTYFQGGNSGMMVAEGTLSIFNPVHPESVLKIPAGSAVLVPLNDVPKGPREYMEIEKKLHEQDTSIPDNISSRKNVSIITGRIAKLTGQVKITYKDSEKAHDAVVNEILNEGDKIATGHDGIVEVTFDNGNAIYLKPDTNIVILRLVFDSKSGEYENIFQSDRGKIKARIEKLQGKSKFEVKTPTAVCGARGTIMYLNIAPSGVTDAFFEGGNGYSTNLISGQTMEIGPGGGATSDTSGGVTETTPDAGSGGGDSGGSGGLDEGFDPSAGTSDHTSTESTTSNYMYSSDTSTDGVSAGSEGSTTSEVSELSTTTQTSDTTNSDNGLQGGSVDVPITVADKAIEEEDEPAPAADTQHVNDVGDMFYSKLSAGDPSMQMTSGVYDFIPSPPDGTDNYNSLWTKKMFDTDGNPLSTLSIPVSGNYDNAGLTRSRLTWTTQGFCNTNTNDGGEFYSVMGGTINTSTGGKVRAVTIGLYINKYTDAGNNNMYNAGVIFGKASTISGDNGEGFNLSDSQYWVSEELSARPWLGSASDLAFSYSNGYKDYVDKQDGSAHADFASGSEVKILTCDSISNGFDNMPDYLDADPNTNLDFGFWASGLVGSYKDTGDLKSGFTMTMTGDLTHNDVADGAFMQYIDITKWSRDDIEGTVTGAYCGLGSQGKLWVGAMRGGMLIGNMENYVQDGSKQTWQAVAGGEWVENFYFNPTGAWDEIDAVTTELTTGAYFKDVPVTEAAKVKMSDNGIAGCGSFTGSATGTISNVKIDARFYQVLADADKGIWAAAIWGDFTGTYGNSWSAKVEDVAINGSEWNTDGSGGNRRWKATLSGTVHDLVDHNRDQFVHHHMLVDGVAEGSFTSGNSTETFVGSSTGTWIHVPGDLYYSDADPNNPTYVHSGYLYDIKADSAWGSLWSSGPTSQTAISVTGRYERNDSHVQMVWTLRDHIYGTAPSGGDYFLMAGGTTNNDTISGKLVGLYIDPSGNAGTIDMYGDALSGTDSPEFTMTGLANVTQMDTGFDTSAGYLRAHVSEGGNSYGSFSESVGSHGGSINGEIYNGAGYSIVNGGNNEDWGVWGTVIAGSYVNASSGNTLTPWVLPFEIPMTGIFKDDSDEMTSTSISVIKVTKWDSNKIECNVQQVSLGLGDNGSLWGGKGVGSGIGNYVEVAAPGDVGGWQLVSGGMWMDSPTPMTVADIANNGTLFLSEMNALNVNVPITEVTGSHTVMSGAGSSLTANMDMRMYQTAVTPALTIDNGIWAALISGNYVAGMTDNWLVTVANGANSATLSGTKWDTTNNEWRADVSGTVDSKTITGAATGTIIPDAPGASTGTISGSATGEWSENTASISNSGA